MVPVRLLRSADFVVAKPVLIFYFLTDLSDLKCFSINLDFESVMS
jgi:hypothetical protein